MELKTSKHSRDLLNPSELEILVDRFLEEEMKRHQIPGCAFSLVDGNSFTFSKGYGFADLDKKTEIVPNKTICNQNCFRYSSSS